MIAISYSMGLLTTNPVTAATNTQVATRVSPRLIDLVAALATGAVGAIALCRSDISDTLPGVAIAISLVPPLTVIGLTLESGDASEARGALLLFTANVTAILAMGAVVMAIYRVHRHAPAGRRTSVHVAQVVAAMVILVAIPLAATSRQATITERNEHDVREVAETWAAEEDWEIVSVSTRGSTVLVQAAGPLPAPKPSTLGSALAERGLEDVDVELEQVPVAKTGL